MWRHKPMRLKIIAPGQDIAVSTHQLVVSSGRYVVGPVPAAPDASPADAAIAGETSEQIARAMEELPPQQRLVVALKIWEGLSYAEIAEMTGRTEATVRSNMHHGLAALRKAMAPHLVH